MFTPDEWTVLNWIFAGLLFGVQLLAVRCFPRLRLLPVSLACLWTCLWLFERVPMQLPASPGAAWRIEPLIAEIVAPSFIPALALLTAMVLCYESRRPPPLADSAFRIPHSALP